MSFPIRIRDVMSQPVETVSVETTAREAAAQCDEHQVGSVVVVEEEVPVGIVTSADLVRLLGSDVEPASRPVGEFMSAPVVTIPSEASLVEAVATMQRHGIARLVALENEAVVGVVTTDDVAHVVPQLLQRSELVSAGQPQHYRVRQETAYERPSWEFESRSVAEDRVTVGDTVEFSKTITEGEVRDFAEVSGDTNRLHLDEEYARETRFGRRIVHGTLVGSLISAALARLPGLTIYVSQDLSFRAPVDIGQRVTATCEVVEDHGRDRYTLTTDVTAAEETLVIEGQAVVLIDPPRESEDLQAEALA